MEMQRVGVIWKLYPTEWNISYIFKLNNNIKHSEKNYQEVEVELSEHVALVVLHFTKWIKLQMIHFLETVFREKLDN